MNRTESEELSRSSMERIGTTEIEIRMPNGKGGVSKFIVDNSLLAYENKDFMTGFSHMLLSSRRESDWHNQHEFAMIREATRRKQVTCRELYNAFWEAYSDQYTPASGIEWRHLWKHIEEARMGRDRRFYTYDEMLRIVDKEGITTDHFEFVEKDKWRRK